jgi:iron complex outermembrane recepter protein
VPTVGNYFNTKITPWTKQLGGVFDLTPNIATYLSWSQSVKPQTAIAFDSTGNSDFPPEAGEQFEGGAKIQNSAKNLNLTLAYYQITRNNVIVATGQNFAVPTGQASTGQAISRLDGEQQSKGYEIELQWQPVQNWQLQFGYANSDAKITKSITNPYTIGLNLANAPKVTGNFWTRYNVPHGAAAGLGFGGGIIYVGEAWAGDPTSALYYILPSWTRADASIYYKFGSKYDIALNIQNLTDKRYIASAQSAQTLNVGEQRKLTLSIGATF